MTNYTQILASVLLAALCCVVLIHNSDYQRLLQRVNETASLLAELERLSEAFQKHAKDPGRHWSIRWLRFVPHINRYISVFPMFPKIYAEQRPEFQCNIWLSALPIVGNTLRKVLNSLPLFKLKKAVHHADRDLQLLADDNFNFIYSIQQWNRISLIAKVFPINTVGPLREFLYNLEIKVGFPSIDTSHYVYENDVAMASNATVEYILEYTNIGSFLLLACIALYWIWRPLMNYLRGENNKTGMGKNIRQGHKGVNPQKVEVTSRQEEDLPLRQVEYVKCRELEVKRQEEELKCREIDTKRQEDDVKCRELKAKRQEKEVKCRELEAKRQEEKVQCRIVEANRQEEKVKCRELEAKRQEEELKCRELEAKRQEEELKCREVEAKRQEEEVKCREVEAKILEEEVKCREVKAKRKEEKLKCREVEAKRQEEEVKCREVEANMLEEEVKCREVEAKRQEEEVKCREVEAKWQEEEMKCRKVEAKRQEEVVKCRELDAKRQEEELKCREVEAKRQEEELKCREVEAKRQDEKLKFRELETKRHEKELKCREVEAKRQEEAVKCREVEVKRQEEELKCREVEAKRQEEEVKCREVEAKRQEEEDVTRPKEEVTRHEKVEKTPEIVVMNQEEKDKTREEEETSHVEKVTQKDVDKISMVPVGLENIGNTCYMNAGLQVLMNVLQKHADEITEEKFNPTLLEEGSIARHLCHLMFAVGKREPVRPYEFKRAVAELNPMYIGSEQQDSHEFVLQMLTWLHNLLNQAEDKTKSCVSLDDVQEGNPDHIATTYLERSHRISNSLITDLFQGLKKFTKTCYKCYKETVEYENFNILSLNFPEHHNHSFSLRRMLEHTFQESYLGDYRCEFCDNVGTVIRDESLYKLPQYMILHLNRFHFSMSTFSLAKISSEVSFPVDEFDITDYYGEDGKPARKSYELCGIVNHIGELGFGHYTALVRAGDDLWYNCDDRQVSETSPKDSYYSYGAYMLVYRLKPENKEDK